MSRKLLSYLLSTIFVIEIASLEDQKDVETLHDELEHSFRILNSEEDILGEFSAEEASLQSEDPAYISELFLNAYPVGAASPDCPHSYKSLQPGGRDLNKGAGGLNIYLCAKYSKRRDSLARGITDLKVTVDIKNPPQGYNPTPPEGYIAIKNNISDEPLDLNAEAGKWMRWWYGVESLYLWQKISNDTDHLIIDINFNFSASSFAETACLPNYKDTGVNLNLNAGGDAIRLCYLKFQHTVEEIVQSIQTEYSQYPAQAEGPSAKEIIESLFLVLYPIDQLQGKYYCPDDYTTFEPSPLTKYNLGKGGLTLFFCARKRHSQEPFHAGIQSLVVTTGTENPPEGFSMVKNQLSDGDNINLNQELGGAYLWQQISTNISNGFVTTIDLTYGNCSPQSANPPEANLNLAIQGSPITICFRTN